MPTAPPRTTRGVARSDATVGHRPFALVLAGGGARGAAHAGVLRALEADGLRPAAIVGVSMGAIVGAAYALNPNWYRDFANVDLSGVPGLALESAADRASRLRAALASGRVLRHLLLRWGPLTHARPAMEVVLDTLTLGRHIEEGRIPFAAVATDLGNGRRVVLDRGSATEAAYASSALAGVLPPARRSGTLLADGCYADLVPVDVARTLGADTVIVVNPHAGPPSDLPRNGLQAIMRAMEISVGQRARDRLRDADLELRVHFPVPVATIDFTHHRACIAAGVRAVRAQRAELAALLCPAAAGAPRTAHRDRLADLEREARRAVV